MPVLTYAGMTPRLGARVFVAPGAYVIGNVVLGDESSVWFGSVLRGDSDRITVGRGVNIQDGCVIHADPGAPTTLGDFVSLGHGAIVHACTVEDHVLVGMRAVVLTGCVIGSGSIIGAGSIVTEGKVIPPRSLVLGVPGRVVREVTDEEYEQLILGTSRHYVARAQQFIERLEPARE
ncbi:MAG TPA: gamma carbonic anhydrase family protein [Chloroflexota bacterium]